MKRLPFRLFDPLYELGRILAKFGMPADPWQGSAGPVHPLPGDSHLLAVTETIQLPALGRSR